MDAPRADNKNFFNNESICDKGISILNSAMKSLTSGQYIAFCDGVTQLAEILANLKTGIKADRESLEQKIEELKRMNDALVEQQTGLPVIKEGAGNGNSNN